ncbi:hypothetical protein BS17DRAFT_769386 [Gyrodon lividus]|nr:hypothetical protein BS17DRAFT_769386 [Gyrodon lividus]
MSKACSDDFSSVKQDGLAYILANMESETITPKISKGKNFDADPENTMELLLGSEWSATAKLKDFPSYLYKEDLFNLSSFLEGLFHSDTTVQAWGIMKMTPHIVAWEMTKNTQIRMFNLAEFYYTIAELLKDPDNAWAMETLDWLT